MASSFEIIVKRTGIGELTRITQFHKLEYVLVENDIGALTLTLPDTYPSNMFAMDTVLEVYRTLDGVTSLEGETVWFVRNTSVTLNQAGEWLFTVVAFDAKELLKRRIVGFVAGSAESSKGGAADNMMREIVRENLGPSATADYAGNRYIIGVEPDLTLAPVTNKSFAWRNVLAVLQEIAVGFSSTRRLVFNVVKNPGSLNDLEFRVRLNTWGIDHGQDSGQAIVFSPDNGSLSDVNIEIDGRDEISAGTVGGQGEGAQREVANFLQAVSLARSYWNRREAFVDARNMRDRDDLVSEAVAYLLAHWLRQRFTGRVQQTEDLEYGIEYRFGDKVVISAHGVTMDAIIKTVHVVANAGGETIDITLSADALLR